LGKSEEIRSRLLEWVAKAGPRPTLLGKVKSVNESEKTCVLYDDDTKLDYNDVRLRPVLDGKESITIFPKTGTWALAVRIESEDDWMIVAVGEVAKWSLGVGTATIEQDSNGLLIQKGNDTLKDILTMIIEAVQQIVVAQGTSPDYAKLIEAMLKVNNLLK
jgi:hypothetical protein